MVAQEHNNIGHGSELLEYADAVRVSVDYIAQDIEGILGLKSRSGAGGRGYQTLHRS